ncbi:phospho-sugar mutase [Vallitalea okinawensis]|uniref:phospho-sugar mutase n=1 Tax=Vallitalea okinawensis TaxID=2078660 RepID=UPI000CFBD7B5|nr:phospho-sugar mutase [Vallitalea okinawensis]
MFKEKYSFWLESPYFDEATKEELRSIEKDEKEIEDRFYKDLEFGTGGLRGIIGAGSNRMNVYTVRKATQGLANYINQADEAGKNKGVAIAYDSRRMSPEFAKEAALVLNGNGIKTYVFESLRPTPELSYAVRHLGCIAGIVLTASHNPPEYNGYKVYWEDGCQVPPPRDSEIIDEVNKVEDFEAIKVAKEEEAKAEGLFHIIGKEIDNLYIQQVKEQSINAHIIKEVADDFTVVFTPLHGTGNLPVRRVLAEVGFKNVYVVPEQEKPDSDFSTVGYPNPEDPKAFTLALELAKEKNADIIVGTDPDADRVGVVVKNSQGDYVVLSGNMTGVLLADYIITQKKEKGTLPANGALIKTVVTTEMARAIANKNDIDLFEVLTGFKFIGEKIGEFEETGENTYLFGFEESFGYLAGTYARDKDAVVAAMLACELAAYYKSKGMSLYEGLVSLYEKYGFYKETLRSITLKGVEGVQKIKSILEKLRNEPPVEVAGQKVMEARDYQAGEILNIATKVVKPTNLPTSNVLYYKLENGWFCVRPSGTEPKVKFYFGVQADSDAEANEALKALEDDIMGKIEKMI